MMSKPFASISLDLDNLWCYQLSFGKVAEGVTTSFLNWALPRVLESFEEQNLKATIFVIGQDAAQPENREPLALISDSGHELGNHSYYHNPYMHKGSRDDIRNELIKAHERISDISGQTPVGYRGPAFGISPALISVLIELGYQYDASTFPSSIGMLARKYHQDRMISKDDKKIQGGALYGEMKNAWQTLSPFYWQDDSAQKLLELPVTTLPCFRLPFHGTYLNYLADYSEKVALFYFKTALKLCRLSNVSPSFLLHATDFISNDDSVDLSYLPGMKRRRKDKLAFMRKVLDIYQNEFNVLGTGAYAKQLKVNQCKHIEDYYV